jgi:hypothetical protein
LRAAFATIGGRLSGAVASAALLVCGIVAALPASVQAELVPSPLSLQLLSARAQCWGQTIACTSIMGDLQPFFSCCEAEACAAAFERQTDRRSRERPAAGHDAPSQQRRSRRDALEGRRRDPVHGRHLRPRGQNADGAHTCRLDQLDGSRRPTRQQHRRLSDFPDDRISVGGCRYRASLRARLGATRGGSSGCFG